MRDVREGGEAHGGDDRYDDAVDCAACRGMISRRQDDAVSPDWSAAAAMATVWSRWLVLVRST